VCPLSLGARHGNQEEAIYPDKSGAYAGAIASLKSSVWLDPGAYHLCIKSAGHADYCRRIYVLRGKNLSVLDKLAPVPVEVKP